MPESKAAESGGKRKFQKCTRVRQTSVDPPRRKGGSSGERGQPRGGGAAHMRGASGQVRRKGRGEGGGPLKGSATAAAATTATAPPQERCDQGGVVRGESAESTREDAAPSSLPSPPGYRAATANQGCRCRRRRRRHRRRRRRRTGRRRGGEMGRPARGAGGGCGRRASGPRAQFRRETKHGGVAWRCSLKRLLFLFFFFTRF